MSGANEVAAASRADALKITFARTGDAAELIVREMIQAVQQAIATAIRAGGTDERRRVLVPSEFGSLISVNGGLFGLIGAYVPEGHWLRDLLPLDDFFDARPPDA